MDPKDIYRSANILIEQYGVEAKSHAMQRAYDLKMDGDAEGETVWCRIYDAIVELQTAKPAAGQVVH